MLNRPFAVNGNPRHRSGGIERRKWLALFALEHGRAAYHADFAFYGGMVFLLAAYLLVAVPHDQRWVSMAVTLAGLGGWSAIEYALHRFVLHGMPPFSRWHAEHHQRPMALICAPTILSAAAIAALVFLPAFLLLSRWGACALTLGVLIGYLTFSITHHATHHWRADGAWLLERKRWHAIHHHAGQPVCYGVTGALWDHLFGSTRREAVAER